MVFAVTGCTTDDLKDDVNDLKDRVTLIEEQVKLLNDNLAVVAYILDPQNKTIANVETSTKDQYVITLSNGEKLTLTIGKPGTIDEPEITIGEDGMWYVNGESTGVVAVGTDGKNGEGYPEFRVEQGKWQVRFGDGAWSDVEGGDVAGGVSLGDQIFESAEVDGDKFIVTLKKDGSVHTLPIVETLKCIIDKSGLTLDKEDFLVVNRDERVIVPVQIEGENMQVTCPQGWRATLNKLDVVDEKGNNYQLYIFAPVSDVKAMTRAVADNTADVTVQVQKGAFWAVDKIQVRLPKDYSNNLVKYNDEMPVSVGGLEISHQDYGDAIEITDDHSITSGGVYFVSQNGVTLTYELETTLKDLVIIPTTADVTAINLIVKKQINFTGTFACQNTLLSHQIGENLYLLKVNSIDARLVFDRCEVKNLIYANRGVAQPGTGITSMKYFEISNSDIEFSKSLESMYMITNMACDVLKYHNNIFYYSKEPDATDRLDNLKLIQGTNIGDLIVTSNTFIDVESGTTKDINKGLIALKNGTITRTITIDKNLYYYTYRRCATQFVRTDPSSTATVKSISDNFVYAKNVFDSSHTVNLLFNVIGDAPKQGFTGNDVDFFNTENGAIFNRTERIFTPVPNYKAYGAQR